MTSKSNSPEQILSTFISNACENGKVWALEDKESYAVSGSNVFDGADGQPAGMVCFWSDRSLAKASAIEDWQSYQPVEIKLDDFLENFCIGIYHDGLVVGLNFDENMVGYEILSLELVLKICNEIKKTGKKLTLKKYKNISELIKEIEMLEEEE